jgi:hypothetical protein
MKPTQAEINWQRIKSGQCDAPADNADICNSIYPVRDFGMASGKTFRSVKDFDAQFGVRA